MYPPPRVPLVRALGVKFRVKPLQKWGALEWQQWYEAEAARLTDEQRAKLWSLFDDLPLYGVTDVPLGDE